MDDPAVGTADFISNFCVFFNDQNAQVGQTEGIRHLTSNDAGSDDDNVEHGTSK